MSNDKPGIGPLSQLRVLDLSTVIAGSLNTSLSSFDIVKLMSRGVAVVERTLAIVARKATRSFMG